MWRARRRRILSRMRYLLVGLVTTLAAGCVQSTSEPILSCDGSPTGGMAGRIDGKRWAAGLQTVASPIYLDGKLASISVIGVPCEAVADRANRVQLRIVRLTGIEAGQYSLGPVPPTSRNSAWGGVTLGATEYRSDWSDAAGAGTGTLQVSNISPLRIQGTFEFTAVASAGSTTGGTKRLSVTNGSFDIPLVEGPVGLGNRMTPNGATHD